MRLTTLLSCLDLTLLDKHAKHSDLQGLQERAEANQVAAICVFCEQVPLLRPSIIPIATVVNFPAGNQSLSECFATIDKAQQLGVTEIDYVADYQAYLQQDKDSTLNQCQEIVKYCHSKQLTIKIIMETGAFVSEAMLYDFARELISLDCDFLKTSTGKFTQGATLNAASTLLSAIKDSAKHCGLKVSGGVRTLEQAEGYAALAEALLGKPVQPSWFRIGCSNLPTRSD